jgi:hypothetical protein
MHHERELTREKTHEDQPAQPDFDNELPSTESGSDSDGLHGSMHDVSLVNFQPGEPADPHNWSMVS